MLKNLSSRRKMIIGLVASIGLLLLVLGNSFYSLAHNKAEMYRLRSREAQLDREYTQLEEKRAKLRAQDRQLMEHIARTQYHMLKKGETEFRFNYDADN